MKLQDKVALVTGAGRGIGQAIAVAFAREGARVALAARNEAELRETGSMVEAAGSVPLIVPTDVTDHAQVERLVDATVAQYSRLDILVNNAGISGPIGPLETNDVAAWIDTVTVNLTGIFLCCRAAIPVMLRQEAGKIINLSGAGATNAWSNMSAYCSSKAAVVRLTEVLALELEDKGITVNALGPGSVHTSMWDKMTEEAAQAGATLIHETGLRVTSGGGASIHECAELAVWLASAESGALSGRLISAATDDFRGLPPKIEEIMASEAYTLRRVGL
jgi:3-oxoacyl-[acyl-carrier protein] reductase